jgi:hypothetical protein
MSLTLVSARSATADEWDAVWETCPSSTFFHSRGWADAWQAYTHGRFVPAARYLTFSDGQSVVLPLSLECLWHGAVTNAWLSPAGTYGGWLSEGVLAPEHAGLLRDYVVRTFSSRFWRLNPFDPLAKTLASDVVQADDTHAINLADGADAVFAHAHPNHRNAVRKAQRLGMHCVETTDSSDWRAYFNVYQDSLRRWGDSATSRYGWPLFAALRELKSQNVKLWLAVLEGRIVSGALCFYASRHVVSWHSASLAEGLSAKAPDFVKYVTIRDASQCGLEWYDLNPSGGHEGVRSFKAKLGGVPLPAGILFSPSARVVRVRRLSHALARIASLLRRDNDS